MMAADEDDTPFFPTSALLSRDVSRIMMSHREEPNRSATPQDNRHNIACCHVPLVNVALQSVFSLQFLRG